MGARWSGLGQVRSGGSGRAPKLQSSKAPKAPKASRSKKLPRASSSKSFEEL